MKKRLMSLFTAFALIFMLGAVLPAGGLKAIAASAMTVSVSFDSEKAELTVTWTEAQDAARYEAYIKNKKASGDYDYMPGADARKVSAGEERKTVYERSFFQDYGFGTSDYIVTVKAFDSNGKIIETADSKVITTDYDILDMPSTVILSTYGIASWSKVENAAYYSVMIIDSQTDKVVTAFSTAALREDVSEHLTAGGKYYMLVCSQPSIKSTPIYRYSSNTTSMVMTYMSKSDITGIKWDRFKLGWDKYQDASKYKLLLYKGTYDDYYNYKKYGEYESGTNSFDFADVFGEAGYGRYRAYVTACSANGQPISKMTISLSTDYFRPVDSVNVSITAPAAGKNPDFNVTAADKSIIVSDNSDGNDNFKCKWCCAGTTTPMSEDETFENGKKYTAYFYVSHKDVQGEEPLCVNENTSVKVNNGVAAKYVGYNGNGALFSVTFTAARKAGDINGNDKVDLTDVILFKQFIAGWKVTINKPNADVNGDGKADIKDVIILKQHLAGWNVKLV